MEELVEKAKSDNEAFTELILSVENDLYSIAKMRVKNEDRINDVLQDTMLSAYINLPKLKENKYFKTWIIKILINKCNKSFRSRKTISLDDKDVQKDIGTAHEIDKEPSFEEIIDFLNKDEKTILTLYYYLGYSTKEISSILQKREGTITSKISRAKQKIKNKYKGDFE